MRSVVAMLQKEWLENPLVLRIPLFVLACGVILFVSLIYKFFKKCLITCATKTKVNTTG